MQAERHTPWQPSIEGDKQQPELAELLRKVGAQVHDCLTGLAAQAGRAPHGSELTLVLLTYARHGQCDQSKTRRP